LAEQVLRLEAQIYAGAFAGRPLDESLVADFHRAICAELVPDWAGRWRTVEVRVGNLQPPLPSQVRMRMRDYGMDLPRVGLAPDNDKEREQYFLALEAADRADWRPLMGIWMARFSRAVV
jgi:hypothetical protein